MNVEDGTPEAGDDVKEIVLLPSEQALAQLTDKLTKRALQTWMLRTKQPQA